MGSIGTFQGTLRGHFHDHSRTQGCCSQPNPCPQNSVSSQLPALTAITTVKTQTRPLLSSFQQFYHQVVTQFTFFFPPLPFHIASPSSKLFPLFLSPPSIAGSKGFPLSILTGLTHPQGATAGNSAEIVSPCPKKITEQLPQVAKGLLHR